MDKVNYVKWPQLDIAFDEIEKQNKKSANIIEFGVYQGNSILKMLKLAKQKNIDVKIWGFDSFEGLPKEYSDVPLCPLFKQNNYSIAQKLSLEPNKAKEKIEEKINNKNVKLFKTWFDKLLSDDTLYGIRQIYKTSDSEQADIIHIDCDIYVSTLYALNWLFFNNLVKKGTLLCYDEFYSDTNREGGEAKAHKEVLGRYEVKASEIWYNEYVDKTTQIPIRQNVFLVEEI